MLAPWLATGFGLAALASMPNPEPTEPADAMTLPVLVVAGEMAMADNLQGLVQVDIAPEPARVSVPKSGTTLSVAQLLEGEPSQLPVEPSNLPAPARLDLMFAISGTSTRALPVDYHHPLLDSTTTTSSLDPVEATTSATDSKTNAPPTAEDWASLRWCESRGDYTAVNSTGKYRGAYQFDQLTWESLGGTSDPVSAAPTEQDRLARLLYERRGSAPWPYCGKYLD